MKGPTDGWVVCRERPKRCRTIDGVEIHAPTQKKEPSVGPGMVEILPLDLLEAIMCCVASTSGSDYRRCRHTSGGHEFMYILAENDNPRALFQLGVREFCTFGKEDEGLKKLEKATLLGYTTAKYALGVIKLGVSEAHEGRDEGRRLIAEVKSEVRLNISECRRALFNRLRKSLIWKDKVFHRYYPLPYTVEDHSDTCCMMSLVADSALMFGDTDTGDGFHIVEIAHSARCHACEWILGSKVFEALFYSIKSSQAYL